jgi:hypothetical protein
VPLTTDANKVLRVRFAAIWWLLVTEGKVEILDDSHAEDQKLLLENGVKIKSDENPSLLAKVAKALIQLDDPDALSSQQAVWDFVLDNDTEKQELVTAILDNKTFALGASLVAAACMPDVLKVIVNTHRKGDVIFAKLGPLFQWVKDSRASNVQDMRATIERLCPRLTPKAVSALLQRANHIDKEGLAKARDGFIIPCMQRARAATSTPEMEARYEHFIEKVLQPLCGTGSERNVACAVDLLEAFASGGPRKRGCRTRGSCARCA